jgi:hypothetical protein
MSHDGRHFTARQRIPTEGIPRHPQIVSGPGDEIIVAWDEQANAIRRVAVARGTIAAQGSARFVRQPIGDALSAVYPVLAAVDDGAIVAWTSGSAGQSVLRAERLAK